MAAITFPSSPSVNDLHTVGTRSWKWNGTAWKLVPRTTDAVVEGSTNLYHTAARVRDTALTGLTATNSAIEATDSLITGIGKAQGQINSLDGRIDALGNAFNYVGTLTGGANSGSATDLSELTEKDAGDYYKVTTAGYFVLAPAAAFYANVNDGIVFNSASGVDKIDNTNSSVSGTTDYVAVSGSADTGFTVDLDSGFKTRVSTAESDITAVEGRLDTAEGDITAAEGRLDTAESDITAIEGRLDTAESDITAAEGRLDTAESDITAVEGRLDTAEGDIDALETGKQIKDVVSTTAPSHSEGQRWIDPTDMSEYLSYGGVWVELDKQ